MLKFVGVVLSGGVIGAVLTAIITYLLSTAMNSDILRDGQGVLIILYTVPIGWVLGASAAVGRTRQPQSKQTRLITGLLIVGGVAASPFLSIAELMVFGTLWRLWHGHG